MDAPGTRGTAGRALATTAEACSARGSWGITIGGTIGVATLPSPFGAVTAVNVETVVDGGLVGVLLPPAFGGMVAVLA